MVTDPIGDFLTRIRNGYLAGKDEVSASYSAMKKNLADILLKEGYLASVKVVKESVDNKNKLPKQSLVVKLLYRGRKGAIEKIIRVSKPGIRIYVDKKTIPRVLSGYGLVILSTSSGLMSGKEARKRGMGGEVICKVW